MAFLAALRFLTVAPLPGRPPTPQELAAAPGFYPAVGLVIGLALAGLDSLLRFWLPPAVASALLLVALLAMTGGLHLDGLADTCDGVFAMADTQRRLEIMRDSRVGGYGVAGVALALITQYAALAAVPAEARTPGLVLMATLSRWAMAYALLAFPYARPQGMGAPFRAGARERSLLGATAFSLLTSLLLLGLPGLVFMAVVGLVTWGTAQGLLTRLPGLTGDTYGAINEVAQTVALLALAGRQGP